MLHTRMKKDIWMMAVIFAAGFLLYGNTIPNGYSLDDSYVTQNNPKVEKGFAGIPEIFTSRYVDEEDNSFGYRPVAMATFAIEYGLWGQNAHLSHFINVLLYALILLLLFKVLRKIFRDAHTLFLLAVVLLFAAHPIHTEVVASLKNRETLLSFLFSLVALRLFLAWYDTRKVWPVFAGIFVFALAFLSKQDAVTCATIIPLVLVFYSKDPFPEWLRFSRKFSQERILNLITLSGFITFWHFSNRPWPWITALAFLTTLIILLSRYVKFTRKRETNPRKMLHRLFLFAGIIFTLLGSIISKNYIVLLALGCFAVFFLRIFEPLEFNFKKLPKTILYFIFPLVLLGIAGILFYKLPNLYLPVENKVMYNFENPQFVQDPNYPTIPLALYTLYFYISKLIWPHPLGFYYGYKMIPAVGWTTPEVLFSLIFHLGILAFALWKLPRKHILSFAILYYLATISIFTNIVIKIPGIVGERLAFFPSLGFCIALAWGIFKLLGLSPTAEQIPRTKAIWLSGIMLLILIPYSAKTITRNRDWKDYLTLYSNDIGYLSNSAKANNTYANQLLKEAFNNEFKNPPPEIQNQYLELAVTHLKRTVEIDPSYKFAWNNLGYVTFVYTGRKAEGIESLEKAVTIDSMYEQAHFNLGYAFRQQKEFRKSIFHYRKASVINPDRMEYLTGEADAWLESGVADSAWMVYQKASTLDPSSDLPYIGMGNICWLSGDTLKAIENWGKAFDRNPDNPVICRNLSGYYASKGDKKSVFYEKKLIELQHKSR